MLDFYDNQTNHEVNLGLLREHSSSALPAIIARDTGPGSAVLKNLAEVEVSLVSNQEIARIHADFLDDPTETDVITFQHGELVISVDTAAREVENRAWPLERELLLYVIHGLLHLHGYLDAQPDEREEMHEVQNAIIDVVWPV